VRFHPAARGARNDQIFVQYDVVRLQLARPNEEAQVAVARIYRMSCASGRGEELRVALEALAGALREIEGLQSVSVLRDVEQPDDFVFIEKWASLQVQKSSGKSVSKQAFARVIAALADSPRGKSFEYVLET
jgi:quinol monooxygenase YgiN